MIERGVRYVLVNDAAVSAVVVARVYQDRLPQNPTYPAIVFTVMDAAAVQRLANDTDIMETSFDVISVSVSRDTTADLANKVRAALQRYSGSLAGLGYAAANLTILDIVVLSMDSDYEEELGLYYSSLSIKVSHRLT